MNLVVWGLAPRSEMLHHRQLFRMAGWAPDLDFHVYFPVCGLYDHAAHKTAALRTTCPNSVKLPDSVQLNSTQLHSTHSTQLNLT